MVPDAVRLQVQQVVLAQSHALAEVFYSAMLADPQAGKLLDHEIVSQRLHASMQRWLCQLFTVDADIEALISTQRRTGEIHARIGVPIDWVADGARVLKRALAAQLMAQLAPQAVGHSQAPQRLAGAVQFVYELIDVAIDAMNGAATSNATRMTRSEESYRLFFMSQNLKAERERQKSELLEWAHQLLVQNFWNARQAPGAADTVVEGASQFELWLQHKASVLFEKSPALEQMQDSIRIIREQLVPRLRDVRDQPEEARAVVALVNTEISRIKAYLAVMFDQITALDDGRDGVTQLLNRKYFPAVARREISIAKSSGHTFALLLLELDHFEGLSQVLGVESSDQVLAQVAEALADSVRAGDFIFRIGDAQFLVLLVDTDEAGAGLAAQGLRERVAGLSLRTPLGANASTGASVGVALHDGHPDYQRLLERAQRALLQARQAGGNQVVLAAP